MRYAIDATNKGWRWLAVVIRSYAAHLRYEYADGCRLLLGFPRSSGRSAAARQGRVPFCWDERGKQRKGRGRPSGREDESRSSYPSPDAVMHLAVCQSCHCLFLAARPRGNGSRSGQSKVTSIDEKHEGRALNGQI